MKFSNLNRIYTSLPLNRTDSLTFTEDIAHYLKNVLRLKIGWRFRIFNSTHGEYMAKVTDISKHEISVVIEENLRKPITQQPLTLGLSLIKNDRFTEAIKMAVQLGITKIIPIISARSYSATINYERLQKCIVEATEQSERLNIPELGEVTKLEDFNKKEIFDTIIYTNEDENVNISMKNSSLSSGNVAVLIGPEGGFTTVELELMNSWQNSHSVSLGPYVLRCETAVAAAIAQINLMRK